MLKLSPARLCDRSPPPSLFDGLPKPIAASSFDDLCRPLKTVLVPAGTPPQLLLTGSRILSPHHQSALTSYVYEATHSEQQRRTNSRKTTSEHETVSSRRGAGPMSRVWLSNSTLTILSELLQVPLASTGSYRMMNDWYWNAGGIHIAKRRSTTGPPPSPAEGGDDPRVQSVIRAIQRVGSAEGDGAKLHAEIGLPLSATGQPYHAPYVWRALRDRMECPLFPPPAASSSLSSGSASSWQQPRRYRSPYWMTEEMMELFQCRVNRSVLAHSEPVTLPAPSSASRRGSEQQQQQQQEGTIRLFNAEQTTNPAAFHSNACNVSLDPFVLPGVYFGPTFRPPTGRVALSMSWLYQHLQQQLPQSPPLQEQAAAAAEGAPPQPRELHNVWVQRSYQSLLKLNSNGKHVGLLTEGQAYLASQMPLHYSEVVEEARVHFYVRYCPLELRPVGAGGLRRIYGVQAAVCARNVRSPMQFSLLGA